MITFIHIQTFPFDKDHVDIYKWTCVNSRNFCREIKLVNFRLRRRAGGVYGSRSQVLAQRTERRQEDETTGYDRNDARRGSRLDRQGQIGVSIAESHLFSVGWQVGVGDG